MLNKPIYVGFTALDLSKWKIYGFHHNFVKKKFNVELLFTLITSFTIPLISYGWKNYKFFVSYLYGDYTFKPLHKILPKTSAYVKNYDG